LIEKAFIACTPYTPVDGSNAKSRLAAPLDERQFIGLSRDASAKFMRGLPFRLAGGIGARLAHGPADAPVLFTTTAGGARHWGASAIGQHGRRNMPLYEHVFLARQDLAQAQVDALAENATKIIEDNGGKVVKTETWGLRSLAYRIAKNRKAHYVMLDLDAPAPAIAELERQSNINEDVIRFLTIKVDELEKGPSAMMRRSEKDRERRSERGERSERADRADRGERAEFRAREQEVE
jgi:small subunit ribosomal protein S6